MGDGLWVMGYGVWVMGDEYREKGCISNCRMYGGFAKVPQGRYFINRMLKHTVNKVSSLRDFLRMRQFEMHPSDKHIKKCHLL
jgi:hypothetical protein